MKNKEKLLRIRSILSRYQSYSWRKGAQLVDFGSNKPDVWVNGRPLSRYLVISQE